jgi:hypothetical protein
MMSDRRNHDRRRRVIYTSGLEPTVVNAASIRRTEELRQARRPAAIYGSRVRRRLRGRWYALVPVRQRDFVLIASVLLVISGVLVVAHLATDRWSVLAGNSLLARPFRLDRTDSLGQFFQTSMLLLAAGISLLIYQLRRYRLDDYQGQYRLWRTTLIVSLLAAFNCQCSLIEWSGSAIDAVLGRRLALSGANWVRMVTTMGLFILAIRVFVDVRRSRAALMMLLTAGTLILIPETSRWNVSQLDSWIVLTVPTLAASAFVIGLLAYLRLLYREVRDIQDGPSMSQWLRQMKWSIISKDDSQATEEPELEAPRRSSKKRAAAQEQAAEENEVETAKRGLFARLPWFGRRDQDNDGQPTARQQRAAAKLAATQEAEAKKAAKQQEAREQAERKQAEHKQAAQREAAQKQAALQPSAQKQVIQKQPQPQTATADPAELDEQVQSEPKPRRFGLGRFFKGKSQSPAETLEKDEHPQFQPISDQSEDDDEFDGENLDDGENVDPDSVEWATLNRSDKRRLKKQLRRQGRAA